jgi:hypothetical protein
MAKHRRTWNEVIFKRYLQEKRGQGVGGYYTPWILVQDFPSKGMVSRIQGTKTGRTHHLLSNHETNLFYLLDWSDEVLDIREQYPLLDLHQVIEIAETAQIRYPYDPVSGFPYVMTSDFYIDTTKGPMVISVKTTTDLENPRVREKLEIERRYWDKRNIRWRIITEREINQTKARNIEWLSQAKDLGVFGFGSGLQESCITFFMKHYSCHSDLLGNLILDMEMRFGIAEGMGLNIYKYLAYWKRIEFDVAKPIEFSIFRNNFNSFTA